MTPIRASHLLALPVRLHGLQLGRPVDVLLDREEPRALGLDVECGDEIHRFLPLPTAMIGEDEIGIMSPLVLLEEDQLAFYRTRSFALDALRGRTVERDGRQVGRLVDIVLNPDGSLAHVVVDAGDGEEQLPFDASVRFDPKSRSAA